MHTLLKLYIRHRDISRFKYYRSLEETRLEEELFRVSRILQGV